MGLIYITQRTLLFEYCPAHWCLFDGLTKAFPERHKKNEGQVQIDVKNVTSLLYTHQIPSDCLHSLLEREKGISGYNLIINQPEAGGFTVRLELFQGNWFTAKLEYTELKLKHQATYLKTPMRVTCTRWPLAQATKSSTNSCRAAVSPVAAGRLKTFPICRWVLRDPKGREERMGTSCNGARHWDGLKVKRYNCKYGQISRKFRSERCQSGISAMKASLIQLSWKCISKLTLFFPSMEKTLVSGTMVFPRKLSCHILYSLSMTGPGCQSDWRGSQDQNFSSSSSSDIAYDFQ